jgi:hypothetical protein
MSRFLKLFLLIGVLSTATSAFAQPGGGGQNPPRPPAPAAESRRIDLGQLDGENYNNNFFGLSLSVPGKWVVVSAQRRETMTEELKRVITGDQKKQEQIDDSIQRSFVLLSLTKLPAGEPGNASFMLIAERLPSPSVKNGADVIGLMKKAFTGTNFNVEFQGEVRTEIIGGADFAVATVKTTSPNGTFMQKIYVTTKNGYALELFYTYLDEADLATLDSIIKSVKVTRGE